MTKPAEVGEFFVALPHRDEYLLILEVDKSYDKSFRSRYVTALREDGTITKGTFAPDPEFWERVEL
jgi:hypothetical protein